jgi:hypothetical protein
MKYPSQDSRSPGRDLNPLPPEYTVSDVCEVHQYKAKAVPLHATMALGGRGGLSPTHSRPRH